MFLDASAIVAILLRLPGHKAILDQLEKHDGAIFSSALVRFEAVAMILRATSRATTEDASRDVEQTVNDLLKVVAARDIPITSQIGSVALEAAANSRAAGQGEQLTFGKCFARACARSYRLDVLTLDGVHPPQNR